jgi:hypothetical protein
LFFNLFPERPLLHECSTVPKGAQQSRAKVAHALFCHCRLTLPRRRSATLGM